MLHPTLLPFGQEGLFDVRDVPEYNELKLVPLNLLFYVYKKILCLHHAVCLECDIKLSKELATIGSNGNLSVLCNTSCMIGDNRGDMIWYDNQFNQVPHKGRIFSVSYGRGRYSRLVILHSIPTDEGNYICTLETSGELKQKSFTLTYDGPTPARSNVKKDIGPRRGDVVIYDPNILHRRPKRQVQETTESSGLGDNEVDSTTTIEPRPELLTESSPEPQPKAENTTLLTSMSTMSTIITQTARKQKATTQKPTTLKTTTQVTTAQESTTKRIQIPQQNEQGTTTPMEGGNSKVPNTEFGRSGLVAFVVSLSIALLLLYALVLILLIPMCLKRKKGRTSTKKRTQISKDTPVVLSQVAKSEDNGDLPSPGPSDAGFTTIDLDDPPKDKQDEDGKQTSEQNDDVKVLPSATTDPETTNTQESMLSSVMSTSDKGVTKSVDPAPVDDDLKFIDETTHSTESEKLDDSSVFDNSTPAVVDEPQRTTTETTEVKLEITEKEDGHKQIKLSSSSPPPETQSSN
ncbi:hypothetical protein LOTGIDRAFT_231093 [Lottia gigantea]|uniref:Ig-like domain-containing protein n=1 Tax=Lottia gigantea TaxID=225164 RepID=V4B0A8_LOTGI|nr:hypothetical protein LOTGIDRAFT_231093 [Lottia gigantea]ESO99476.1 hypothetical protein LOTGIDRAFT_231093 [Lottia gigantea]